MRGAQRSSLTKLGCFAAQTSGGADRGQGTPNTRQEAQLLPGSPWPHGNTTTKGPSWPDGWGGKRRDAAEQIWLARPSPSLPAPSWPGGAAHASGGEYWLVIWSADPRDPREVQ